MFRNMFKTLQRHKTRNIVPYMSRMDVIIAINVGINHTSNVCMIKSDKPEDCKEFNVVFDTKSNTQLQTKSDTTPTVALFDDKGAIQSYGFEAEIQHKQFDNASNHLLFREFIWDLFCSHETVSLIMIQNIFKWDIFSYSLCVILFFVVVYARFQKILLP